MKKLIIPLILIVSSIFLYSCTKDDSVLVQDEVIEETETLAINLTGQLIQGE